MSITDGETVCVGTRFEGGSVTLCPEDRGSLSESPESSLFCPPRRLGRSHPRSWRLQFLQSAEMLPSLIDSLAPASVRPISSGNGVRGTSCRSLSPRPAG